MAIRVTNPSYAGVDVNHPDLVKAVKQMKKNGVDKEKAARLAGMPMEVIDKHYRDAK